MLRLGHITDTHLRHHLPGSSLGNSRRSRVMLGLLEEAVALLKDKGVELLVLTGDIADVPMSLLEPSDYWPASPWNWVEKAEADYRAVKRILDRGGLPYIIQPGNHDYEPAFFNVFPREPYEIEIGGFRLIRFDDRTWDWRQPRRFDRERQRWNHALSDESSLPQIHLQHYVITPDCNEHWPHTYCEGEFLRQGMVDSGRVKLSLSGHYHPGTPLIEEQGTYFTTAPCFSQFPHMVRWYDVGEEVQMTEVPLREKPEGANRPMVFLDRDGVITDAGAFYAGPDSLQLIPGAGKAIYELHQAGFAVAVITTQSAIGRGYIPLTAVEATHEWMCEWLCEEAESKEAQPDAIYFSTGAGEHAAHRDWADNHNAKPSTELPEQAIKTLGASREEMWFIGDRVTDLQCGWALGAKPVLVKTGFGKQALKELKGETRLFYEAENLWSAVQLILKKAQGGLKGVNN